MIFLFSFFFFSCLRSLVSIHLRCWKGLGLACRKLFYENVLKEFVSDVFACDLTYMYALRAYNGTSWIGVVNMITCRWRIIIAAIGGKKPEKEKKIRASTGFKPVTSTIPVRCSINWAMKPHMGSEFISSREEWNDVKYIWNNSYLNSGCRWKWRMIIAVNFPT